MVGQVQMLVRGQTLPRSGLWGTGTGTRGHETVLGKSCNLQPKLTAGILVGFWDVDVWMLVDTCEVVLMLVLLQPRLGPH